MLKQGKGNRPLKLVVGISGASGSIYGIRLLQKLKQNKVETHLVITKWGQQTIREETDYTIEKVRSLASFYYDEEEQGAAISSGSFKIKGMIIAPCSMKTLSGIANGYADNLIIRAADVTIKEKRKLILVTRETPLNAIHLENMLKLARLGVTIMPPVPAFYTRPRNVDDIVDSTVDRILDQFEIEDDSIKRWNGMQIV